MGQLAFLVFMGSARLLVPNAAYGVGAPFRAVLALCALHSWRVKHATVVRHRWQSEPPVLMN
jgi:hypothetical protein